MTDQMTEAKIRTLQCYLGELRSAGRGPGNPVYDQKATQLAILETRLTQRYAARTERASRQSAPTSSRLPSWATGYQRRAR